MSVGWSLTNCYFAPPRAIRFTDRMVAVSPCVSRHTATPRYYLVLSPYTPVRSNTQNRLGLSSFFLPFFRVVDLFFAFRMAFGSVSPVSFIRCSHHANLVLPILA